MYRKTMNVTTDRKVFHNTAATTKKINIKPHTPRGGIRL